RATSCFRWCLTGTSTSANTRPRRATSDRGDARAGARGASWSRSTGGGRGSDVAEQRSGPERSGLHTYAWPSSYGEAAQPRMGFFTDTSVCIGCKACQVACKEWNQIPMSIQGFTGNSYDNSVDLDANTWRHVAFVEQSV